MKEYTIGQVIDAMELGEVAIRVSQDSGLSVNGYVDNKVGIYYDEDDSGILKSLSGNEVDIFKNHEAKNESKFIIMNREAYERIIANS